MSGGAYFTKYARNAESARSLPRKNASESNAQASPRSSQPSNDAVVEDGVDVTSEGVSVATVSMETPRVNRAYNASASLRPSSNVQP